MTHVVVTKIFVGNFAGDTGRLAKFYPGRVKGFFCATLHIDVFIVKAPELIFMIFGTLQRHLSLLQSVLYYSNISAIEYSDLVFFRENPSPMQEPNTAREISRRDQH